MCVRRKVGGVKEQRAQMMCCRANPLSLRRSVATRRDEAGGVRAEDGATICSIGQTQALEIDTRMVALTAATPSTRPQIGCDAIARPGKAGINDLLCVNC